MIRLFILILFLVWGIHKEKVEGFYNQKLAHEMQQVKVKVNLTNPPKCDQYNLDLAYVMYSINKPIWAKYPIYKEAYCDDFLYCDEGVRGAFFYHKIIKRRPVEIYCSAFTSWGMLGSVIAHEVEVHGNQDIGIMSYEQIESEAYLYQYNNAERFGLTLSEKTELILILQHLRTNKELR